MLIDGKVVFPHRCPICGKHYFIEPFEECKVCNWAFDIVQEIEPDLKNCGNIMSFNEAVKAFAEGKQII